MRLSLADLGQLPEMLRDAGVSHGPLRELRPQNNLAVTDGRSVFLKLSRTRGADVPPTWAAAEIDAARWAERVGVDTVVPLLWYPLRSLTGRAVTVWRFEPGVEADRLTIAPEVMSRAVRQLEPLHRSAPWTGFRVGDRFGAIARRIATLGTHPESARVSDFAARVKPAWDDMDPAGMVPSHGDPHAGNLILGPHMVIRTPGT